MFKLSTTTTARLFKLQEYVIVELSYCLKTVWEHTMYMRKSSHSLVILSNPVYSVRQVNMLSVFCIIFHFNILLCLINVSAENEINNQLLKMKVGFVNSFNKFANNVKSFISVPLTKIEQRGRIIKDAFLKFIGEATKSSFKSNSRRLAAQTHIKEDQGSTLSSPELTKLHGFNVESHIVITTDGYLLTLHRILPSFKQKKENAKRKQVVLLHHGLLGSSDDWILLGTNKSLPYILSNAGYDVWLVNARGNRYSRAHSSRLVDSKEYWNFSWHEIGLFDLPAAIEYIRTITEVNRQIDFIGHSMGCTALLVLVSTYPQYNRVMRSATLLAPLVFMQHIKGPLRLLGEFRLKYGVESLRFLGETEFMPTETFPRQLINKFCQGNDVLCLNNWLLLANGGQDIVNTSLKTAILTHVPAGGSTKTIEHYAQLVQSGQFQMYDLGKVNNLKKYRTTSPPTYPLSDITLPIVIFSSNDDWLSTVPDIKNLLPVLKSSIVHHVVGKPGFSHTDFLWSENAPDLVYCNIITFLAGIEPK